MAADLSLEKKTITELAELVERQNKILNNKALTEKLPDKGAKVKLRKQQIEEVYQKRLNEVNDTADLFSQMKISSSDNVMEVNNEKGKRNSENENPFNVTASDNLSEIILPKYYGNLIDRMDGKTLVVDNQRLNKATVTDLRQKIEEKIKHTTNKEESAVRYPVGRHKDSSLISLSESLKLQKEYVSKIKELQLHDAFVYLSEDENINTFNRGIKLGDYYTPDPIMKMSYRDVIPEEDEIDE